MERSSVTMFSSESLRKKREMREIAEVSAAASSFELLLSKTIKTSMVNSEEYHFNILTMDELLVKATKKRLIAFSERLEHLSLPFGIGNAELLKSLIFLRMPNFRQSLKKSFYLDFDDVLALCLYFSGSGECAKTDNEELIRILRTEGVKMPYLPESYEAIAKAIAPHANDYLAQFKAIEVRRKLGELLQNQTDLEEQISYHLEEEKLRNKKLLSLSISNQELKEQMAQILLPK